MIAHQLALTLSASPRLYEAASGRSEERETVRLRDEVQRLRIELEEAQMQTREFRVGKDAGKD